MKFKKTFLSLALLGTAIQPSFAQQGDTLQGDQRYACEALLCLASSVRPGECQPSLTRYFGIVRPRYSATMAARKAFLNQCPASHQSVEMAGFIETLNNGADCDVDSLNRMLASAEPVTAAYRVANTGNEIRAGGEACGRYYYGCDPDEPLKCASMIIERNCSERAVHPISTEKPARCIAFEHHEWTDHSAQYVGEPLLGGKWVNVYQYENAKAEYENKKKELAYQIRQETAQRESSLPSFAKNCKAFLEGSMICIKRY